MRGGGCAEFAFFKYALAIWSLMNHFTVNLLNNSNVLTKEAFFPYYVFILLNPTLHVGKYLLIKVKTCSAVHGSEQASPIAVIPSLAFPPHLISPTLSTKPSKTIEADVFENCPL